MSQDTVIEKFTASIDKEYDTYTAVKGANLLFETVRHSGDF